jgi:hypothetical protein
MISDMRLGKTEQTRRTYAVLPTSRDPRGWGAKSRLRLTNQINRKRLRDSDPPFRHGEDASMDREDGRTCKRSAAQNWRKVGGALLKCHRYFLYRQTLIT